jgi:CHAT domain-containing protein
MSARVLHLFAASAILFGAALAAAAAADRPAPKASADLAGEINHWLEAGRLASGGDNYAAAENDDRSALDIELKAFGANSIEVGETLAELALQVSNQSRFDEADALFRRAGVIIQGSADASARDRLTSYLALNAANQRKFADALAFAREATARYRAQINEAQALATDGGPPVPPALRAELAHCLRIEGEMALRLGDVATARAAADEVVFIVSQVEELPLWWRPAALALTAEASESEGAVVPAERNFRGAIDLDRKIFGDTLPTALDELKIAGFYSRQQVYAPAIAAYRQALAILEKTPAAGAVLQPDEITPLLDAALAQPSAGLDNDVFHAVQLMQWGVADQTIVRMAARKAARDPALAELVASAEAARSKRDNSRMSLASEYAKSADEQNQSRLDSLSGDLKRASADADATDAKLRQNFPDYARLANPGPAELSEVVHALKPDEAFVTFLSGSSESFGLSVTHAGLKIHRLDIGQDALAEETDGLRRAFVQRLKSLPEFGLKSAFALYQKILKPLEPDLGTARELVVAPNGQLANLPLALLVTAPPQGDSYGKAAWLIRRFAVSEVPSARAFLLLQQVREQRKSPGRPFLGLGDPVFASIGTNSESRCGTDAGVSAAALKALSPLPDTRREVATVASTFGVRSSDLLLGAQANKTDLEARPLDQFAVLYFATHGLLPSELRCEGEPGLVLSQAAGGRDPVLYASEISSFRLNAGLVILSACNTAAEGGKRFGGGALEGLADSFFDAGALAVLASHWSVPSAATATMMVRLFQLSKQDKNYAEALKDAQLAMIADPKTAHPYYWAAFTLMGLGSATHS